MRSSQRPLLPCLLWAALTLGVTAPATAGDSAPASMSSFNLGWRFHRGDVAGAEQTNFDDRAWRVVDLPHDWSVEPPPGAPAGAGPHDPATPEGPAVGYLRGGTGWYRRTFTLPPERSGQSVEVIFDGVQQDADVWLNGHPLGFQPHGYIPFHYDLTPHLAPAGQPNVLAVRAVNPESNSRWYAGSGLYRPVALQFHGPVHVPVWGSRVDTLWLTAEKADLQIRLHLRNASATPEQVSVQLHVTAPGGATEDFDLGPLNLAAGATEQLSQKIALASPRPWTPDTPALYQAEFRVLQAGRLVDTSRTTFGLRTVSVSAETGFLLNGQAIKLKGACLHHDNGLLGAAAFPDADFRRVALMKRQGFNAIRTSHNPPSASFLEACDQLGMLVIDEFTDMWELPKKPNGYQRYFAGHWEQDLRAMLARDYNHPSIVIWSIGNEIQERAKPAGLAIARDLIACIRMVDHLRPVTNAICTFWDNPDWTDQWDPTAPAFALLDIGGYNYMGEKYESDHAKFPARVMAGTESYPKDAYAYWRLVEQHPYVIGDFVWTGMDHLGESGIGHSALVNDATEASAPKPWGLMPWPTWINLSGDIDLIGNPKPQALFRDVVWNRSPIELAVHVPIPAGERELVGQWGWPDELPSWNWPGAVGQSLQVNVYSKASRVRLELNGQTVGEQTIDPAKGITATFQVPYAPGALRAIALDGEKVLGSRTLQTPGPAAALALLPESAGGAADRGRVIYVPIELRDAAGQPLPDAAAELSLAITGPAELAAFGSANPLALGPLADAHTTSYRGRALAILRPTGEPGTVHLRVASPNLPPADLEFPLAKFP